MPGKTCVSNPPQIDPEPKQHKVAFARCDVRDLVVACPGSDLASIHERKSVSARPALLTVCATTAIPCTIRTVLQTGTKTHNQRFCNDNPAMWRCGLRSGPRMGAVVYLHQARGIDGGIGLSGGQRCMAQQFLNGPQITARTQQMGGKAVAQRVRRGR